MNGNFTIISSFEKSGNKAIYYISRLFPVFDGRVGLFMAVHSLKCRAKDNSGVSAIVLNKNKYYVCFMSKSLQMKRKFLLGAAALLIVLNVSAQDTVTLEHTYYTSHFVNSKHIPWFVEYTLHKKDVDCKAPLKRTDNFKPDPLNKKFTDLEDDYKGTGYDRGHCMPAADNQCHGKKAMDECFYFSNMFPQTHRLNAGAWKTLEENERDMAVANDSIFVCIGSYGTLEKIGKEKVVVPKYCWKVIYNYKTEDWSAYIFPNTEDVTGKPEDFATTVEDIESKANIEFFIESE